MNDTHKLIDPMQWIYADLPSHLNSVLFPDIKTGDLNGVLVPDIKI